MLRPAPICALLAAVALAAVPVVADARGFDAGPRATAARACHLSSYEQRHLGTTYVLTVRVDGTTCANGKKVVKAFHRCRHGNGGSDGRCRREVYGYKCSERRFNVISSQYDARVRCTKPGREIFHKYTQNT